MVSEQVSEEVKVRVDALVELCGAGYRYAQRADLREMDGMSGADVYGYVGATWVLLEQLMHADSTGDVRRTIESVHRFVAGRRDSLRPGSVDLNEEGEIIGSWFERNQRDVSEYFLGAMRIKRALDPGYTTQRLKRSELLGSGSGRYRR